MASTWVARTPNVTLRRESVMCGARLTAAYSPGSRPCLPRPTAHPSPLRRLMWRSPSRWCRSIRPLPSGSVRPAPGWSAISRAPVPGVAATSCRASSPRTMPLPIRNSVPPCASCGWRCSSGCRSSPLERSMYSSRAAPSAARWATRPSSASRRSFARRSSSSAARPSSSAPGVRCERAVSISTP